MSMSAAESAPLRFTSLENTKPLITKSVKSFLLGGLAAAVTVAGVAGIYDLVEGGGANNGGSILLAPGSTHTQSPSQSDKPLATMPEVPCTKRFTPAVVETLEKQLKAEAQHITFTPGGEIVITCGQEIVIKFGYGKTRSTHQTPNPDEDAYEEKSGSKVMTAWTSLVLADQGKENLNDKVSKDYTQFDTPGKDDITLNDLGSYGAGYPEDGGSYTYLINGKHGSALVDRIADLKLNPKLRKKGAYANASLMMLGFVNRKAAGEVLWKWQKSNIAEPAGVQHDLYYPQVTRCAEVSCQTNDRLARAYGNYAGHDGLHVPATDIAKMILFPIIGDGTYNGHRFAAPGALKTMTTTQRGNFAFGFFGNNKQYCGRLSNDNSPHMACKYGDNGFFVGLDPVTGVGIVHEVDDNSTGPAKVFNKQMLEETGQAMKTITR